MSKNILTASEVQEIYGSGTLDKPWSLNRLQQYNEVDNRFYHIQNSAVFDGSTGYLSRLFVAPTSANVWSVSWWRRLGSLAAAEGFFGKGVTSNSHIYNQVVTSSQASFQIRNLNSVVATSAGVSHDINGWQHCFVVSDGTTVVGYINGQEVFSWTGSLTNLNTAGTQFIGQEPDASQFFSGYVTEFCFVDGIAHTTTDFGIEFEGVWIPKEIIPASFTWGNNGCYVPDLSTGIDVSGNGNDWTKTGTITSTSESPTDNRAGTVGCAFVWNPLVPSGLVFSNGNKDATSDAGNWRQTYSTLSFASGKFYFEVYLKSHSNYYGIGVAQATTVGHTTTAALGGAANEWALLYDGSADLRLGNNALFSNSGLGLPATTDIIQVAVDADAGKVWFGKNNTWIGNPSAGTGEAFNSLSGPFVMALTERETTSHFSLRAMNDEWTYAAPTGFKALSTTNLPSTKEVLSDHFATVLWTGDGVDGRAIDTGLPNVDFIWLKNREFTNSHFIFDSLRGAGNGLSTNTTGAEAVPAVGGYVASLDNGDGTFTVTSSGGGDGNVNNTGDDLVGWAAKLPIDEVNTSGTISVTWKYNTVLGMAVGTYTGTGVAGNTLGLPNINGTAPFMHIHKGISFVTAWAIGHEAIGTNTLRLNETSAATARSTYFNTTAPTASLITLGTDNDTNAVGQTYAVYVFWETDFCKPINFEGNASINGSFWYAGGLPVFVLSKNADAIKNFTILDTARDPDNVVEHALFPDSTATEDATTDRVDFISTGIKARSSTAEPNTSGTYIGLAFIEPQKRVLVSDTTTSIATPPVPFNIQPRAK